MSVVRSFIAVKISPDIQRGLGQVSKKLQDQLEGVPVRWIPVENIHLTLKFLGNVSMKNLELLKKVLKAEISNHNHFEISVGELGAFPNISRPRVLWVGVEAPQELASVQRGIETEAVHLGYPGERRSFSPHLTLGRVSRNASSREKNNITEILKSTNIGFLGAMHVDAIHLFQSDLKPGGAVYTCLFSASLSS